MVALAPGTEAHARAIEEALAEAKVAGGSGRSHESIARRRRERLKPRKAPSKPERSGQTDVTALAAHLWANHRLLLADAQRMLAEQGGCCGICRTDLELGRNAHVDHDHACCPGHLSCGRCVRGPLCVKCNTGLGKLGDTIEGVTAALDYLQKWSR